MLPLIALYTTLFSFFTWRHFRLAVLFLITTLPVYLIRFSIGPLPSTLLELNFGIIFLVWLIRYAKNDIQTIKTFVAENRFTTWSIFIFFIASIASIFISDMWFYSFGQWRAYILQPFLFFFILIGRSMNTRELLGALSISTISISIVGILQKITGSWYPPALWDDELFGRVTSFFTSPNAVGLYVTPIIALTTSLIDKGNKHNWLWYTVITLGILVLIFAKSVGALGALCGGALIWIFLRGYKKLAVGIIVLSLLTVLFLPQTRALLSTKEKSGSNRLTLWSYSWEYVTASPKNFVFGAGIRQFFRKIQKPHYDVEALERLIYPHNIIFNFWTELGLFGLLGFLGIFLALIKTSFNVWKKNTAVGAALLAGLTIFFLHGLLDVPYFKNDLAFLFWGLAAGVFLYKKPGIQSQV